MSTHATVFDVQAMLPRIGVDAPSDIQVAAIPEICRGQPLAIQSFTGSGKVRLPA
jgi:superfamily II DNA/RNA helicase